MNARYGFLLTVAGITLAGYLLGFSDIGYLKQSRLKEDLTALKDEIQGLKQENAALGEDYVRLRERVGPLARHDGPAVSPDVALAGYAGGATILKFEEPGQADEDGSSPRFFLADDERMSLVEARALFLTAMFFLAIVGFYLISRLEVGAGSARDLS